MPPAAVQSTVLSAESFSVPAATRFRRHEHEGLHICAVLEGGFLERDGTTWQDTGPGTLRVSGSARHDIDFSSAGARCLVIEGPTDHPLPCEAPRFFREDPRLSMLSQRIAVASMFSDPSHAIERDDLITELLAQIHRRIRGRSAAAPPWLARIREAAHDVSGPPSMARLSEESGVHRVHIARAFKDHYGVSFTTYARKVRVRRALDLLAKSTMPLSQLAATAGFADQSHLTREIRSATGTPPGALRSRLHPFKT